MSKITGTYQMTNWQESPLREMSPPQKCTQVTAPGIFTGPLEGEGQTFYILNYNDEKSGAFTGFTFFKGKIGDLEGSFVLADDGTFDPKAATTKWTIVKDSGTGDLIGISGRGGFSAIEGLTVTFELDFDLPR